VKSFSDLYKQTQALLLSSVLFVSGLHELHNVSMVGIAASGDSRMKKAGCHCGAKKKVGGQFKRKILLAESYLLYGSVKRT